MPGDCRFRELTLSLILPLFTVAVCRAAELPWPNSGFEETLTDSEDSLHRGAVGGVTEDHEPLSGTACLAVEGGGFSRRIRIEGEGYLALGGYFCAGENPDTICITSPGLKTPSHWAPQSAVQLQSDRYTPLSVAGRFQEHLLGLAQADIFVRNGHSIYADDFFAYDNRLANPSFGSGLRDWEVKGSIESGVGNGAPFIVRMEAGSSLSQRIAAEPYCDTVFQCRAKAALSEASLSLEVVYYNPIGIPVVQETTAREIGSEWTDVSVHAGLPATAAWGEISIRSAGPGAVILESVDHACLGTPYRRFSPNDDGIYDNLPVSAWINRDASVTLSFLDSKGTVVRTLYRGRLVGQTFWEGSWEGDRDREGPALDGDYEIRLEARHNDGTGYSLARRIEVDREPRAAARGTPPLRLDFFPRGFWMNVHDCYRGEGAPASATEVEAEYDRLYARMRECQGNVAVPAVLDQEYAAVRRAAEKNRIYQIPSLYQPELLLRYADPLEEVAIWESYREALQPWLGSPYLLGTYPLDEPTHRLFERAGLASAILSTLAPEAPAFFSLTDRSLLGDFLDRVKTSAVLFHDYPCAAGESALDLDAYIRQLEQARGEALVRGLPFWAVLQTFSEAGRYRNPTPAEFRAMAGVALALGSKGLFSFLFNSSRWSNVEGLLDRNFESGELLDAVSQVYGWIASNEALLLNLEIAQDLVSVEPPAYARTHVDKDGGVYFFVVNTNPNATIVAELVWSESATVREREVWKNIELDPGEFVLLKADEQRIEHPGLPNLQRNPADALFSRFKRGAKSVLEPVAGDFDWKQVGRIHQGE